MILSSVYRSSFGKIINVLVLLRLLLILVLDNKSLSSIFYDDLVFCIADESN